MIFNGEWYLETKISTLAMFIATGHHCLWIFSSHGAKKYMFEGG